MGCETVEYEEVEEKKSEVKVKVKVEERTQKQFGIYSEKKMK